MSVLPADEFITSALQSDRYPLVRSRVLRQLMQSLLFEELLPVGKVQQDDEILFMLQGSDASGLPVRYQCSGRQRTSFGRIRLHGAVTRIAVDGIPHAVTSPGQLLLELFGEAGVERSRLLGFIQELEQTVFHDTLAQYLRMTAGRGQLQGKSWDELESELMDGHPYHPSYKSRLGFSAADPFAFAPEFNPAVRPVWLAVHRAYTYVSVSRELGETQLLESELGPVVLEGFRRRLEEQQCDPLHYLFIPVHPWQWRERIAARYAQDLRDKNIVVLGPAADEYRPQQSIRTLSNRSQRTRASIKLSMSLLNTSSMRHLSPPSVAVAPWISDWLQELVDSDAYLSSEARVILLREFAGVSYDRPGLSFLQPETDGALGCIWRESLEGYLAEDEQAVPYTALTALEADGTPFIQPWLEQSGVEPWVEALITASVLPVVHLLQTHGIALESHAQNMILVHRGGVPVRAALKDFHEDLVFCRESLGAPEKCPDFEAIHPRYAEALPGELLETDEPVQLAEMTLDALFHINLAELAMLLADRFDYPEERFWSVMADRLEAHADRFPPVHPALDLFQPVLRAEQLTGRRLGRGMSGYNHDVPNPLYTAGSIRTDAAETAGRIRHAVLTSQPD